MLIVFHVIFLIVGLLSPLYAERIARLKLAGLYLGGGLLCLLFNWLVYRTTWRAKTEKRNSRRKRRRRQGSVLIMVLVILSLVSGIVLETQVAARAVHRLESSRVQEQRLQHLAASAVWDATRRLADDEDLSMDHPSEPWALPQSYVSPEGPLVQVLVRDENRWFDVNNLSIPDLPDRRSSRLILRDILTQCGHLTPAAPVQALADWVDDDDQGLMESFHYRERNPAYATPNRILYGWSEWLDVDGWSREDFEPGPLPTTPGPFQGILAETVTLVPVPRTSPVPVNLNTASEDTLRGLLGLGQEALVRAVVARRKAAPLRRLDTAGLPMDPADLEPLLPYLDIRSGYFRIEAVAAEGERRERVQALVRRDTEGSVEMVQWLQ